jgi:hypothetical protein
MPFGVAIAAAGTAYAANRSNKASKEASKAQAGQNAEERDFILQQTSQARDDVNRLYGMQADNSMMGGQAALDILRGSLPQQAGLFNQGQNNAMSAILGGQVTPFQQPDFGFIPQTLPQYKNSQQPKENNILGKDAMVAMLGAYGPYENVPSNVGTSPSTKDLLNPLNYAKDPVGGAKSIVKKIESKDPARKALKKLF